MEMRKNEEQTQGEMQGQKKDTSVLRTSPSLEFGFLPSLEYSETTLYFIINSLSSYGYVAVCSSNSCDKF